MFARSVGFVLIACITVLAAAIPAFAAPTASAAKHATWQQVQVSLTSAGLAPYRNVAKTSSDGDMIANRAQSPDWYVWVFTDATTRNGEDISGYKWAMRLVGKYPGPVYWTHWIPFLPGHQGDYYAVKLYGDNLALVFDVSKYRRVPHPSSPAKMPGTWIAIDQALSALTK